METTTQLPLSLVAVICTAFFQSLYFIKYKPLSDSPKGGWAVHARALSECRLGSKYVLLAYRTATFLYCTVVGVRQCMRIPATFAFRMYTVWNWWLLVSYFLLVSICSWRGVASKQGNPDRRLNRLEYCAMLLMHVNMTTVLIVDVMTWGVLVPMLKRTPSSALNLTMFYTFTSYNQHGMNAAFIYLDILLNAIPVYFYMLGYVGLLGVLYGSWAIVHHNLFGWWLYPFLDSSKPWAPMAYVGLLFIHWTFFFAALGVTQLLRSLRPKPAAIKVD